VNIQNKHEFLRAVDALIDTAERETDLVNVYQDGKKYYVQWSDVCRVWVGFQCAHCGAIQGRHCIDKMINRDIAKALAVKEVSDELVK